jgi:hypothetical protein
MARSSKTPPTGTAEETSSARSSAPTAAPGVVRERGARERKAKPRPVVFMLQPTDFQPVKPRRMGLWEEQLKSVLGESAPKFHQLMREGGFLETTSICPGGGADDCDVFEGDVLSF